MSTPGAVPRRPDASMTLLNEILERPLDPTYAAVAARRRRAGLPPAKGQRSLLFTVTLLVVGLGLGVSAHALQGNATARSAARADLIRQVHDVRAARDARAATVTTLSADVAARDAAVLAAQSKVQAQALQELSQDAGVTAVSGPGLILTVADAPQVAAPGANSDPRSGPRTDEGIVRARDLQVIVNSLWASGAEAMMINGQRLTSTSAIRFAGAALLVNNRPLVPPYVISAIGDPGSMPGRFAQGTGGAYIANLKASFGIGVDSRTADDIHLPASPSVQTRVATPLRPDTTMSAPAPTKAPSPTASGGTP